MSLPRMSDIDEIGGVSGADSLSEAAEEIYGRLRYFPRDKFREYEKYCEIREPSHKNCKDCTLTSSADEPLFCPLGSATAHAAMIFSRDKLW